MCARRDFRVCTCVVCAPFCHILHFLLLCSLLIKSITLFAYTLCSWIDVNLFSLYLGYRLIYRESIYVMIIFAFLQFFLLLLLVNNIKKGVVVYYLLSIRKKLFLLLWKTHTCCFVLLDRRSMFQIILYEYNFFINLRLFDCKTIFCYDYLLLF